MQTSSVVANSFVNIMRSSLLWLATFFLFLHFECMLYHLWFYKYNATKVQHLHTQYFLHKKCRLHNEYQEIFFSLKFQQTHFLYAAELLLQFLMDNYRLQAQYDLESSPVGCRLSCCIHCQNPHSFHRIVLWRTH